MKGTRGIKKSEIIWEGRKRRKGKMKGTGGTKKSERI